MILNRRHLVKASGLSLAAGLCPTRRARADDEAPHYFIELVFRAGWDPTQVFDARPAAMTAAGKIQNYRGDEPSLLTGTNGGKTLVTSFFEPLRPFFEAGKLSILNGVHMAAGFDGHEQNLNYLFAGNPFGGNSFIPYLNGGARPAPIDFLQIGDLFGTVLDNVGNGVSLDPGAAQSLTSAAVATGAIDGSSPVLRFLNQRLAANSQGGGRYSAGVQKMQAGLAKASGLSDKIREVVLDIPQGEAQLQSVLKLAHQYFVRGLTQNVVIEIFQYNLDTHDSQSCKDQVTVYPKVVADIQSVLQFLSNTGVGDRSLLDLTTVVATSEFSRTMRQVGVPIDNTGTDHNPLNNTVLLAGKMIKGGQIFSSSDQETLDAPLSGAHRTLDQDNLKIMGRPFDFDTMQSTLALPDVYDADHYLTFASVANTLMKLFGASDDKLWAVKRNGAPARLLGPGLIG